MSKMHDLFLAWIENVFPEATEKQKTQIMCHAIRVYWMMENWDLMPPQKKEDPELREEDKPGCFGAIGKIGKRKDPECPCAWKDRCRQSQEDC